MKDKGFPRLPLDAVAGESHAENEYHAKARPAFLRPLINTSRCKKFFDEWSRITGLYEPVLHTRAVRDRLVALTGAEPRTSDLAVDLLNETFHAAMQLRAAILSCDLAPVRKSAIRYVVNELKLQWMWVAEEMTRIWFHTTISIAIDIEVEVQRHYERTKITAPDFELNLKRQPGETYKEAIARIKKEADNLASDLESQRQQIDLPEGRRSWADEDVERYVGWFYRHKIEKETIYKIAQKDRYGRKEVGKGIKYAERWLSIGYYHIAPDDKDKN